MMYFISDLHLGHDRGFIYKQRGFQTIEEHDKTIIANWNKIIKEDDDVYVLGDLIMGNQDIGIALLNQLKGNIYMIRGNHDTENKINRICKETRIKDLGYASTVFYKHICFYLSHYPTITSSLEKGETLREHTINLYGHVHTRNMFFEDIPFMYNVGCNAHNCTPVSMEQIIRDIKEKIEECKTYL